jgi:hypothetical protein
MLNADAVPQDFLAANQRSVDADLAFNLLLGLDAPCHEMALVM